MAIIDSVKAFIETCPLFTRRGGKINVNYLGEEPIKYSIEPVPVSPVIKRYTDGGEQRQFLFVIASRESYSRETLENMNTAKFYEEFQEWVEQQEHDRNYPEMDAGKTPTGIGVMSSGYLYTVDGKTARFQIQCRLVYDKERMI